MENLKKVNNALDKINDTLNKISSSPEELRDIALEKIIVNLDRLADGIRKTDKLYEDCIELVKRRMEVSGE